MSLPKTLTPVATPSLNAWRVPMWVEDHEYTVCIKQNTIRMYDAETLPDFIKASMSMIHAFPYAPPKSALFGWSDPRMMMSELSYHYAYTNNHDPRLNDIGWRVDDHLYMLILNTQQLESMSA